MQGKGRSCLCAAALAVELSRGCSAQPGLGALRSLCALGWLCVPWHTGWHGQPGHSPEPRLLEGRGSSKALLSTGEPGPAPHAGTSTLGVRRGLPSTGGSCLILGQLLLRPHLAVRVCRGSPSWAGSAPGRLSSHTESSALAGTGNVPGMLWHSTMQRILVL